MCVCVCVFQDVSAMTEEEQLALALQMSMSGMMEGAMETELTSAMDQVSGEWRVFVLRRE